MADTPVSRSMSPSLFAAKRALRSTIKLALKAIPSESIASQSETVTQALLTLPEYTSASRLSIYMSMPSSELQTPRITTSALAAGKTVFIPHLHRVTHTPQPNPKPPTRYSNTTTPSKAMSMFALAGLDDYKALKPDAWGIPSLPDDERAGTRENALHSGKGLDLVLMPGVAFGEDCRRLGHGKGYYDFWLARFKEEFGYVPKLVGLALKEQVVGKGEVPTDESDWLVDVVVTGDGRIIRRQAAEDESP